jgi:hypothetical protein
MNIGQGDMMTNFTDPTKEEAIAMLSGGLGKSLIHAATLYVMPLWWICSESGQPKILQNGSCFILDCGHGPFVVTAAHVLQGFKRDRENQADTVSLIGELRFDLTERLIASHAIYDVATFRITESEVTSLTSGSIRKAVIKGDQANWPPKPPMKDRGVFFAGFPGKGRELQPYKGNSEVQVDWDGYTALAVADSISPTDINLIFEHENSVDIGLRSKVPDASSLGGCSGAPLLTFVEHNSIFSWRLGGIIYECGNQILKAARADCLNPDGSIVPHPNDIIASHRSR